MQIKSISDPSFAVYGRVVTGYDFAPLTALLEQTTPKPEQGTVYVPSDDKLETLPVFAEVRDRLYGGMPIQFGYCNGSNTTLNCLEYHRDSEINILADDIVLLVASQQKLQDGKLDTAEVEAFSAPKGTAVELYATTLHYAPCNGTKDGGFRVVIVLPRGTNTDMPEITPQNNEDTMLRARNKWLTAHPDTNEARTGAFVGLFGENIDISALL